MLYKNKRTGNIMESDSKLGGSWVEYNPSEEPVSLPEEPKAEPKKECDKEKEDDPILKEYPNTTIEDVKKELDALGVKYNQRATKAELLRLMRESR